MSRPRWHIRAVLSVRAAALVLLTSAPATWASAPVTLTDANTASNPIAYTAGPYFVRTAEIGCTPAAGESLCDDTQLTVSVSAAVAASQRVVVRIDWPAPVEADFDLYILQGSSSITAS